MYIKKLVAPIVITLILLMYYGFILLNLIRIPESLGIRILWLIIPLALMGVSVFVLIERIREIRSGDEDDLGKY